MKIFGNQWKSLALIEKGVDPDFKLHENIQFSLINLIVGSNFCQMTSASDLMRDEQSVSLLSNPQTSVQATKEDEKAVIYRKRWDQRFSFIIATATEKVSKT